MSSDQIWKTHDDTFERTSNYINKLLFVLLKVWPKIMFIKMLVYSYKGVTIIVLNF